MSQNGVVLVMFATSLAIWWNWWQRWQMSGQIWERSTPSDSKWDPALVALVLGYVALCVVAVLRPRREPSITDDVEAIMFSTISLNIFLAVFVLVGLRITAPRRLAECDLNLTGWKRQIQDGLETAVASFLPVFLMLLATYQFRSAEGQHVILRKLMDDASPRTLALAVFSAVIVVPLAEELLFRVVLLGWLKTWTSRRTALIVSSLTFAAMHGWPDVIALVPLAFLLGALYDHRHRLLPVYVAHAFFNLANILLTLAARG